METDRDRLLAERAETIDLLRGLDASFVAIVEGSRDTNIDDEHDTEGATVAVERQMVSSLAREARERLERVDRALQRLDAGTYGLCLKCGRPISPGRLEARPSAERCIDCA